MENYILALPLVAAILLIVLEVASCIVFLRSIKKPLTDTAVYSSQTTPPLFKHYKETHSRYKAYKEIKRDKPELFKMIKLSLKSHNIDGDLGSKILDILTKTVFAIALASMGFVATVSVANLNFLNSNKNELNDSTQSIQDIFSNFTAGLDFFNVTLNIAFLAFTVALIYLFSSKIKKNELHRHLTIVEEIEKEIP
ncbi:hypothetical protein [Saccharibacillus brassicae]|uniref:MotA/TolQ/ExbB proton channel family protein n=1 Tax=Saccharibacillus brassicae TaxID=2583377 RepID=A0A4Y6V466_SACBS|nr:hypothetical protein [Saccharibacillus brassicae]QDH23470.1 hypothetical protein FFV09_22955 [Saccharibacillus brassicae]